MDRLQKVIAQCGVTSRRGAEELIKNGKVLVNGDVAKIGDVVGYNDVIVVNGKIITREEKVYYLLNKPRGVICSAKDEKGRKTVVDLIDTDKRIYPVGRLDYDTTGVLILTNDGELSNILMHPRNGIPRSYYARVEGKVIGDEIHKLERGVLIDGVVRKPLKVKFRKYDSSSNSSYLTIILGEGCNHEVKKMFQAIGHSVMKLKRERFAFLDVCSLKSGEYRKLSKKEVNKLYSLK